jgi:hypothetical protein
MPERLTIGPPAMANRTGRDVGRLGRSPRQEPEPPRPPRPSQTDEPEPELEESDWRDAQELRHSHRRLRS